MACATKDSGQKSALVLLAILVTSTQTSTVTWTRCARYRYTSISNIIIPRGVNDTDAFMLNVTRCKINDITYDDLKVLPELGVINLNENDIHHIDAAVFRDNTQILYLDLNDNKLNAIPNFGANFVLPEMISLQLKHNEITKLDNPDTFSSTKKLIGISLENNKIEYIHPGMFTGLKALANLSLKNNKLTHIFDKTFAVSTLTFVSISNNSIEIVEPEAFTGTRQLKELNLEGNKLTNLPENFIFKIGPSLRYFCFHRNPWKCDYVLSQIKILKTRCYEQYPFSDGTEPVCKTSGVGKL